MNLIFMGTPDFAVPSIDSILRTSHKISAIVTAPDKERGRGQKLSFTPVKEIAIRHNIPLLQPVKLKDKAFVDELEKYNADLFVVVAFRILPREVFTIPRFGSFNLHASILPKFRGAAPIQWAIIKGEKETGVTTFKIEEKVDTGNIYLQEKISIEKDETFGELHDKLSLLGAKVVVSTIDLIESVNYELKKQDNSLASPAPKITKETGLINWDKNSEEIHNLIRGLSPYPGAYFFHNNKMIKIFKSEIVKHQFQAGSIHQQEDELIVGCSTNSLKILELQLEGKKRMGTPAFLRGFNFSSL